MYTWEGMDWAFPDARVLFVCLCVCLFVCLCVCSHVKIRAGESIGTRLGLV